MISTNRINHIELSPEDHEFVNLISNRITAYGSIPYTVPQQLIIDVIKTSARFFFRYSYGPAQERRFYVLRKSDIIKFVETDRFAGIPFKLPSYIHVVRNIKDTNPGSSTNRRSGSEAAEVSNLSMTSANGVTQTYGINQSMYVLERVCQMTQQNMLQSITGRIVGYEHNHLTGFLILHEDTFEDSLVLDCECNVDLKYLYNDNLFIRYVLAECKKELKRIIGGHTIELPGGATLNPDEVCNNLEDSEKIEDLIKNGSNVGDLILRR